MRRGYRKLARVCPPIEMADCLEFEALSASHGIAFTLCHEDVTGLEIANLNIQEKTLREKKAAENFNSNLGRSNNN